MAKRKLKKFAEVASFSNTVALLYEDIQKGLPQKGKWHSDFFKNNNPLVLELGCGKGEYTVGLAKKYPNKNFIGMDIKGNRLWTGAKFADENKMNNVGFVRTRIDFIEACYAKDEVNEIWITFPDPQPQTPRERKRLTNQRFLNRYKNLIKPDGIIHLKTDSKPLWEYTLEVIKEHKYQLICATDNLYKETASEFSDAASIQTHYETLFRAKGFDICYLQFRL